MKKGDRILEAPQIEWAELMEAKSWDKYWILNSDKAYNLLKEKWVEIWETYEFSWKIWKVRVTINGISDDVHGFNEESSQEDLRNLRGSRASVWVTVEWEEKIWFIWYVKDFSKRPSWAKGFIIWTWKDKMIFDEVDTSEIEKVWEDPVNWVLDLL